MNTSWRGVCTGRVFKCLVLAAIVGGVVVFSLMLSAQNSLVQLAEFLKMRNPANESASVDLTLVPYAEMELSTSMTALEIDAMFYMFISRQHYICRKTIRLGNSGDGGWAVCLAGPYQVNSPCLVYSFGINGDWSFDDAVVSNFGCTVRAFDPSMKSVDQHVRGSNIHFYKVGLGGKDYVNGEKWQIKSLPSIVDMLGDQNKIIDYLKFDIEFSEYETIKSFYSSSVAMQLLQHRVKQVGFEIHLGPKFQSKDYVTAVYDAWSMLSQFERKLGFRRWYFGVNPFGLYDISHGIKRSCCYEIVYINTRFL